MGNVIIRTGGAGADSDELTANKSQVLENYTAITHDSDGDPAAGTMPDLSGQILDRNPATSDIKNVSGFWSTSTGYGGDLTIKIPQSGYIKDTQIVQPVYGLNPEVVKAGALIGANASTGYTRGTFTADANATSNKILSPYSAYVKGAKVTGSIASMGGQTITPSLSQQIVQSYGKYMTGNVVIPGFTMPPANVIKKGYTLKIYNQQVTGSFEGYVTGAADIYRQGAINPNYSLGLYNCPPYEDSDGNHYQALTQYRTNTIFVHTSYNELWSNSIQVHNAIDLTPINNIHISIRVADGKDGPKSTEVAFGVYDGVGFIDKPVAGYVGRFSAYSMYKEVTFSVKAITRPLYLRFWFSCDSHVSWEIDHIWFD